MALNLFIEYLLPYKSKEYTAQNLELNKETRLAFQQQYLAEKVATVPTSISSDKSQLANENKSKSNYRGIQKNPEELKQDYEDFFDQNSPKPKEAATEYFEVEEPSSSDE